MKTVLVDVDGTINNFTKSIGEYIEKNLKLKFNFETDYYDLSLAIEGDDKAYNFSIIDDILTNCDKFWMDLELRPNVYYGLKFLYSNYDLKIVTAPWINNTDNNKRIKTEYLLSHFPFLKESDIIFEHEKWKVKGDIIIDDKPEIIQECNNVGMTTIIFDNSFNKNVIADYRLSNWVNIADIMHEIKENI